MPVATGQFQVKTKTSLNAAFLGYFLNDLANAQGTKEKFCQGCRKTLCSTGNPTG